MNEFKYIYNGQKAKIIYNYDHYLWIKVDDGSNLVVHSSEVKTQGKFKHLRNLPIDTKVLVRDSACEEWMKRHFSHVSDDGNSVFCFDKGRTSFTAEDKSYVSWFLCEVYQE